VLAGGRFAKPFHGVRDPAPSAEPENLHEWIAWRARQYAPRLRDGQFFSHDTALALWGTPLPRRGSRLLHVSAYRPAYPPRTPGVRGHRPQTREPAATAGGGFPVETPARAWVQVSRHWAADDLVAAADFLIGRTGPRLRLDDLAREAQRMRGTALDRVLADVRYGSESPEETRLRLALIRGGLPEPELNGELRDTEGRFIARLDLRYLRFRVGIEYDGRQHASDVRQFRRDADRWDAIRDEGWLLVRILDHHLHPDASVAVRKARAALESRGWRAP
jgi:hypothetical protein